MRISIAVFLLTFATINGYSQDFKVMFYNVENLFDTFDDPETNDDSFTPNGENHWTRDRFNKKLNNVYKVIAAAGENRMPDIVGLCEIENRYVLKQLTEQTPLAKYDYDIVHYDSPDPRGIDVALLYRKNSFKVLASQPLTVNRPTRDILYVKGLAEKDTLHFFVNHWPSKWRGAASEKNRINSARFLKQSVDSIFKTNSRANICIMGDFNDYPDSRPVKILDAKTENTGIEHLYSLSMRPYKNGEGSIVYKNKWEMIDLFFVSGNLMFNATGLNCSFDDIEIFKPDFLLENISPKNSNKTPKRTYKGTVYVGGFSDHLPVLISFKRN